jgi:predicted CXXCH cytochrome family protein
LKNAFLQIRHHGLFPYTLTADFLIVETDKCNLRRTMTKFQIFFLLAIAAQLGNSSLAGTIIDTKHNLSATGPGDVRALTEDKICVFCHTPHNATPFTPLWNKKIEPKAYTLYHSSTLSAQPGQPSGPSRLCLSCHDGTIALGDVLKPPSGIDMITERFSSGMRGYLGTDISNDHPVAFSYYDALPNPELSDNLPAILHTYGGGNIHCTTCHDPHDDSFGNFLVMDNTFSALCVTCHDNKNGWNGSAHATSSAEWDPPALEEPPQSVAEYGCESCHIPHGAGGPKRILRYLEEEQNCYPCHNGTVATTDIEAQFTKTSHHPVEATKIDVTGNYHDPAESVVFLQDHVECVDCHNPHAVNALDAEPPDASGSLAGVSGKNISGIVINPLTNQYELCFKCHGDSGNTPSVIERWIDQNDTMLEFNTANPSYHPVTAMGRNSDIPSIPSSYEPLLNVSSIISCVDCHDSDESSAIGKSGPRGPHGSIYTPILRQQYGVSYTAAFQPESESVYALCYRCHDRSKLLNDNGVFSSFLHGKHVLEQNAPCYICHDPHGVQPDGDGDHTHLINFATSMVSAFGGNPTPFFIDGGSRTGSCTLVCHGRTHDGGASATYP